MTIALLYQYTPGASGGVGEGRMLRRGFLLSALFLLLLIHAFADARIRDYAGPTELQPSGSRRNYREALSKSILFFEGQRSGRLPPNQRLKWRRNSGLRDGAVENVDLVGGYYDAGDNVKFGFPMAFTATMLGWSVLEFGRSMGPEIKHARAAIRWATDYFLKATARPGKIYVQVGDPVRDHNCWERPEDMDTPRTVYSIDTQNPGSEVAAETAAALAAASIVFRRTDPPYSKRLLQTAIRVFDFADKYRGSYSDNDEVRSGACPFYCSVSGYEDELLWGAAWLHRATGQRKYLTYIKRNSEEFGAAVNPDQFGWDDKHAGTNVLLAKYYLLGNVSTLESYNERAEGFLCSLLEKQTLADVRYTPGGLLYEPGGVNMQRVTALAFLLVSYAKYLRASSQTLSCPSGRAAPGRLEAVAQSQIDYILGDNPQKMSFMVGYGGLFPERIHHRASSLPSLAAHPKFIPCNSWQYLYTGNVNPNQLTGAVVGGPDSDQDKYVDYRADSLEAEPTTYINAPLVGALAFFSASP